MFINLTYTQFQDQKYFVNWPSERVQGSMNSISRRGTAPPPQLACSEYVNINYYTPQLIKYNSDLRRLKTSLYKIV